MVDKSSVPTSKVLSWADSAGGDRDLDWKDLADFRGNAPRPDGWRGLAEVQQVPEADRAGMTLKRVMAT